MVRVESCTVCIVQNGLPYRPFRYAMRLPRRHVFYTSSQCRRDIVLRAGRLPQAKDLLMVDVSLRVVFVGLLIVYVIGIYVSSVLHLYYTEFGGDPVDTNPFACICFLGGVCELCRVLVTIVKDNVFVDGRREGAVHQHNRLLLSPMCLCIVHW